MRPRMKVVDKAEARMEASPTTVAGIQFDGLFQVECLDADGSLKWTETFGNLVTNEGLNHILDVQFHGETQVDPWYVGLKGTGSVAAGDTLASHAGWTEFTDYTGDRQTYVEAAASSQQITNSASPASFSITGAGTVAGAFLASVTSGTSGKLFCAADFSTSRSVDNGDTLNKNLVQYKSLSRRRNLRDISYGNAALKLMETLMNAQRLTLSYGYLTMESCEVF